jgi:tellurite methyltransferase
MTLKDRHKWNARYSKKAATPKVRPIIERFCHLAQKGNVLDLAAGLGSNALYLAQKGFHVFAVDISQVALSAQTHRHPNLLPICLDLDSWDIPPGHFDLILNIRFLNRRFFPQIIEGLKPGGVLIAETYLADDLKGHQKTSSPCRDYFLRRNELLHAFLPLHLIYYSEEVDVKAEEKGPSAGLVGIKRPLYPYQDVGRIDSFRRRRL